jgi:heme exporter protein B
VRGFLGLVRRDVVLAFRQGGEVGLAVGFFVLAVVLFPFGVGPEPEVLGRIGAGIIWVAALLAAVSSLDRLFAADYADGGLDLMVLSPLPLEIAVAAKCTAHWLTTGLPLTVISPVLAIIVNLDSAAMPVVFFGLLIGTPALSLLGAIAAALTLGARRPGVLASLLVLPLYLPPLIFGAGAAEAAATGAGAPASPSCAW